MLPAPDGSLHSLLPPLCYVSKSMEWDALGAEIAVGIACGADSSVCQKQVDDSVVQLHHPVLICSPEFA